MSFRTTDFTFAVISSQAALSVRFECHFDWFPDEELEAAGRLPALQGAPAASWVLARLRGLDESIPAENLEHTDGGGYCLELAVAAGEKVVATFQLQGGMEGVAVLGSAVDAETADRVHEQFVQSLGESPADVAECVYTVIDPDWSMDPDGFIPTPDEDSENIYGYRDGTWLGAHNIRED